jgi:hypothetical protein
MERAVATTSTESVGLGMTLTEGTGTFGLIEKTVSEFAME